MEAFLNWVKKQSIKVYRAFRAAVGKFAGFSAVKIKRGAAWIIYKFNGNDKAEGSCDKMKKDSDNTHNRYAVNSQNSKNNKNESLWQKLGLSAGGAAPMFLKGERIRPFGLSVLFTSFKILIVFILMVCAAGLGLLMGVANAYIDTTPMLELSALTDSSLTSYIYDCNGELITTLADMEYRDWADIDEIHPMLINAVVAIEDVRFYNHNGVDYKRLISAVVNTFRNQDTHGGSTITQQLIKNTILTDVQSYKRKIQEAYLAMELENVTDKRDILEAYLNNVFLGDMNYGVKAAARDYFDKDVGDLTVRECAMLAGIIQKPSGYNPRLNSQKINPDTGENYMWRTNERTDNVINAMYNAGFLNQEQRDAALSETVVIAEKKQRSSYEMPFFVEYAITDIVTQMLKVQGKPDTAANRSVATTELKTGGYHIYLTVDPEIQKTLEYEIANYDHYPQVKDPNQQVVVEELPDGSTIEKIQPQVAAVIYEHRTGNIVAIVGGREHLQKNGWNIATQSKLEVGSSIKPIAVYAPAIDTGLSPASIAYNIPAPIEGWNTDKGYPAINGNVQGPVTIRAGIRSSLNVVAARVLLEMIGLETSVEYMVNLGIPEKQLNVDGSGLALGTSGITMIQMVGAYGTIANDGVYQTPLTFTRIEDPDGNVVLDASMVRETRRVLKESTAFLMIDMMKGVITGGTGTNANIPGMTVAGKTGTNSDYSSVCFSGFTPYYTASVWIGHEQATKYPLAGNASGGSYAAPLWRNFMQRIHEGLPNREISNNDASSLGLVYRTVCTVSGLLATEACRDDGCMVSDLFVPENAPKDGCDMHHYALVCQETGQLAAQFCPYTEVRPVILIRPDSPYMRFLPELLLGYFPNAVFAASLDEAPRCSVHSDGGGSSYPSDIVSQAQQMINRVETYLEGYHTLNEEQVAELRTAITLLRGAMGLQTEQSEALIISGMNALKQLFKEYTGIDL